MNYVIYADIMLLWIFVINYLTYFITCRITNNNINTLKLLLWSIFCSIILEVFYLCIVLKNPAFYNSFYLCMNIMLLVIFVKYILKVNNNLSFVRLMICNVIGTILLGGIFQLFNKQIISLKVILPVIIIICLIITIIHNYLPDYKQTIHLHKLIISTNNCKIKAKGYMDTGNTLRDIYTGKPVIIVDYSLVKDLITDLEYIQLQKYIETGGYEYISSVKIDGEKLYPIPFKTINENFSVMPCFKLKSITLDNNVIHKNVVAGIGRYSFGKNANYNVLLNNNL